MIPADKALQELRDGNRRFVSGSPSHDRDFSRDKLAELAKEQKPFAIILGCSDARVPAEIVFDQGIGDLFVIRVAGNVIAPSLVGSVEFAASRFGTRLVIVLGHTRCGAIEATLESMRQPENTLGKNLASIVNRVRPSLEGLLDNGDDEDALMHKAVRANVVASANQLRHGSKILEQLIREEELKIVGAEYSLETGEVDFFDFD